MFDISVHFLETMQYFNNKQSRTIDELIQLHLVPDQAGDRWILKQVFLVNSTKNPDQFSLIILSLIDKTNFIVFKYIDFDGNIRRN
jgi:hypothetical protein